MKKRTTTVIKNRTTEKLRPGDRLLMIHGLDHKWRKFNQPFQVVAVNSEVLSDKVEIWIGNFASMPWTPEPGRWLMVERPRGSKALFEADLVKIEQ